MKNISKKKIFITFWCIFSLPVSSSIEDYLYIHSSSPSFSNYGTVGLIQMPSARFHDSGSLGFSWSSIDPYMRGSIIAYPFSWLEVSYGYTDIDNALYSNNKRFSGDQSYKDKGFDAKLKILDETDMLPSIAVGIRDLAGSNKFEAEFFAFSKKIKNIDYTFGIGWGDLSDKRYSNPLAKVSSEFNNRITNKEGGQGGEFSTERYFRGKMGFFGGAEVFLPNLKGLRVKIEYDTTQYRDEAFGLGRASSRFATRPVKDTQSRINFGLVYPLSSNLIIKSSFVKGNTVSFGFSYSMNLGKKNKSLKRSDPYKKIQDSETIKSIIRDNDLYYYRALLQNLKEKDLLLQKASKKDDKITISYSQSTHSSHTRAAGRVARVLDEISPDEIKTFEMVNINAGMALAKIVIDRESFSKNADDDLYKLTKRDIQLYPDKYENTQYEYNPVSIFPKNFWSLEPSLRAQIGGPDNFLFGDLRFLYTSEIIFSHGITLSTDASVGVWNNLGSLKLKSDSILPHVRTDIAEYLKGTKDFSLDRLQLNIFKNPYKDFYYKLSGGVLEPMFSGFGGEVLYRPFYKDFAIGADIYRVQQRDYNGKLGLLDYKTTTGHINFYYAEPRSNILLAVKGGKFLAGDSGVNIDFSRYFPSGFILGAFFSKTDISAREFGEGSFDKGFYFVVPLDIFGREYSKKSFPWGLKPLTRDGAAILNPAFYLYGVTEQANSRAFTRDYDDLYD